MEKFWAVILIFAIVAAGGLLYVNQVYNPQKDSQAAMADMANQTLSAVKAEMENDTTPTVVTANSVIQTIQLMCKPGNTVTITLDTDADENDYTTEYSSLSAQMQGITNHFLKTPVVNQSGVLTRITFKIIN